MATQTQSKAQSSALRGMFKRDAAKERMSYWHAHRPDHWSTLSPAMRADVERYEQARTAAAQGEEIIDVVR